MWTHAFVSLGGHLGVALLGHLGDLYLSLQEPAELGSRFSLAPAMGADSLQGHQPRDGLCFSILDSPVCFLLETRGIDGDVETGGNNENCVRYSRRKLGLVCYVAHVVIGS